MPNAPHNSTKHAQHPRMPVLGLGETLVSQDMYTGALKGWDGMQGAENEDNDSWLACETAAGQQGALLCFCQAHV